MNEFGIYSSHFQAYVAWVDHNGSLNDLQEEGVIEKMSPQTGRNFHLGVFKLGGGGGGGIALNVVVPQEVLGSFKVPQVGDVVWIEESRREYGANPIYKYSTYNSTPDPKNLVGQSPIPQWGSFSGDYGHLRTHRDHNKQFFATINSNFVRKYVKSITGYRFRSFYRSNLTKGRFSVRGDSVFDIGGNVSDEYLVESGAYVGYGGDLESDQGIYPNPLNVPSEIEEDENYSYINVLDEPMDTRFTADHYDLEEKVSGWKPKKEKVVLKNKNYVSYQPVLDKDYLDKAEFERELPAAEEYQVALRGNNKLLIQDQYGDGEQLLITLKNQYDSGFTIVHNADKSQVRVRDHLGQGVLLEANPEAPRVISWTANRQVIEQGGVKDVGEFTYIRNGSNFGDSQTEFGTKTGLTKDDVPNQEFLMVSTAGIIGEINSRLSSGMNSLVNSAGSPGIYMRSNTDPDTAAQSYSMYRSGTNLVIETAQENLGFDGAVQSSSIRQEMDGTAVTQTNILKHDNPAVPHEYSETVTVSSSEVTKTTLLERVGEDTIETLETITGTNTAMSRKTTTLPNLNQIIVTEDGSTPSITTNILTAGVPAIDRVEDGSVFTTTTTMYNAGIPSVIHTENSLTPSATVNVLIGGVPASDLNVTGTEIETIKYLGGAPASRILQNESTVDVMREAAGAGFTINVGNDVGTGSITLGNSTSPVIINGSTLLMESVGATQVNSGATISTSSVGNTSISSLGASSIDAGGAVTISGSSIDLDA